MSTRRYAAALAGVLSAIAIAGPALAAPAAPASTPAANSTGCEIAAVGDVAGKDDIANAVATGKLIAQAGVEKVVTLGDLAYDTGTPAEFQLYKQAYGHLDSISIPLPGNHENKSKMSGYRAHFGNPAPNLSSEVCGWRVLSIDQYNGIPAGVAFIKAEAAAHPDQPLIVAWHEPRWSSGSEHGSSAAAQPLWQAAVDAGAEIALTAHDHNYERFAPMDAAGNPDPAGTVEFVSGLGGHHPRPLGTKAANSAATAVGTPGVLFLDLAADGGYSWRFEDVKGQIGDSGSASAGTSPASTTTSATGPSTTATPSATSTAPSKPSKPSSTTSSSKPSKPSKPTTTKPAKPSSNTAAAPSSPAKPAAATPPVPASTGAALSWAPPAGWESYPVEKVTGTSGQNVVDCGGGNAQIELPDTPVSPVKITNCENAVMIGGEIKVEPTSQLGTEDQRAIYVKDDGSGIVHIEGVLINGNVDGSEADGITASSPATTLQVQNVRVEGLRGSLTGNHADVFQAWGGLKEWRFDRVTGESNYQGIQTKVDRASTGRGTLRNVNIRGHDVATTAKGGWLYWFGAGNTGQTYPITLENAYVEPRPGRDLGGSVWNNTGGSGGSVTVPASELGGKAGEIKAGPPPGGDFVPTGVAGPGYQSPGYQDGSTSPTQPTTPAATSTASATPPATKPAKPSSSATPSKPAKPAKPSTTSTSGTATPTSSSSTPTKPAKPTAPSAATAPAPAGAGGNVVTESGSLAKVVDEAAAKRTSAAGDEAYDVPTDAQAATLAGAFGKLMTGDQAGAAADVDPLGYDVVALTDTTTGREHALLRERSPATHHWGLYVWSLDPAASELVVEAPHTKADAGTHTEGQALFDKANGRAFLMSTTHRDSSAATDVDGDRVSDLANADGVVNPFQAVHEVAAVTGSSVVQIHGFADASNPDYDVIVSEGQSTPSQRTKDLLSGTTGLRVAVYDGKIGAGLGATGNVQGIQSRAVGVYWLHVEQNATTRSSATIRGQVEDGLAALTGQAAPKKTTKPSAATATPAATSTAPASPNSTSPSSTSASTSTSTSTKPAKPTGTATPTAAATSATTKPTKPTKPTGTATPPAPAPAPSGSTGGGLVHPGIMVDGAQLDLLRKQIAAGAEPQTSALQKMKGSMHAAAGYTPKPRPVVECGPYSKPDFGCNDEKQDATAAYTNALLWALTDDQAAGQRAVDIMNAWASVYKDHTNSNAALQASWPGGMFARAAELMRSFPAWSAADQQRMGTMLRSIQGEVAPAYKNSAGNQGLSAAEATVNIGIFLDDRKMFDDGIAHWREETAAYLNADGSTQETCRDMGHTSYGLASMVNVAETARIQGIDLYGEVQAKIVPALDQATKIILNGYPSGACSGKTPSTPDWKQYRTYEIAYNEYAGRRGQAMPNVKQFVDKWRAVGGTTTENHMQAWETFTHGGTAGR